MCGIAGVMMKPKRPVPMELLDSLKQSLKHRGPDGDGVFTRAQSALVHTRLSIIDVAGGAQPITDKNESSAIVGNGEVYNYQDLHHELVDIKFKTKSDIEPALHLYQKHGISFVEHLRGMYALAIYDAEEDVIVLARDTFGIKQLYWAESSLGVMFASEPAALVQAGWVRRQVNRRVLPAYLNRNYVTGRQTLFEGVNRVLPGEIVVIQNGKVSLRKRFEPKLSVPNKIKKEQALQSFNALFESTVKTHLQSEVPYGLFLSGGIDSSSVAVAMRETAGKTLNTFTIGFSDDSVKDERSLAEELAMSLKTNHQSITFGEDDFWKYLPVMCKHMDDLVSDYAVLPVMKLAEDASKSVKVVLSGEGGDEFFAGYGRYRKRLRDRLFSRPFRGEGQLKKYSHLFQDELAFWQEGAPPCLKKDSNFSGLQKRQMVDISSWLPDDLLIKADRCLMAYGVEGRVPFVDKELSAFGFSLPDALKMKGKQGKFLVKIWLEEKLSKFLGNSISSRVWGKKSGFTVPIRSWLNHKREELKGYLISHQAVQEIVKKDAFSAMLSKPLTKQNAQLVFNLLCFALWHDIHISGKTVDGNFLMKEQYD